MDDPANRAWVEWLEYLATCPRVSPLVRTTRKWLDAGVPICCCGTAMVAGDATETDE